MLGLLLEKCKPNGNRNMKAKGVQLGKLGILQVAIASMLVTMLVMPFAASARLVPQAGRLERVDASAPAAGSTKVLKDASFSAAAAGVHQANPADPQHIVFPAAFRKFGTILAAALLVLPFGLSTLRILRRHRAA